MQIHLLIVSKYLVFCLFFQTKNKKFLLHSIAKTLIQFKFSSFSVSFLIVSMTIKPYCTETKMCNPIQKKTTKKTKIFSFVKISFCVSRRRRRN